jgi:acetyl-CoA acetyltransferase
MKLEKACVPLGFAWSSPFARWQGPLAEVNSIDLAVDVTKRALKERGLPPEEITDLVLGWTVPQKEIFYGAPTLAARIEAEGVTGPMISQACATSVACVAAAAANHESNVGYGGITLVVTTDRTSNGPVVTYPSPSGPGGSPQVENWVLDSFAKDPWAGAAMATTGENVAEEAGITREELDEVTLVRYAQYQKSLENDREFQRSYMVPVEIPKKTRRSYRRRGRLRRVRYDQGRPREAPAGRGGRRGHFR